MQRWHLFTGFALTALLAAAIVPTLRSAQTPTIEPKVPSTRPVPITTSQAPTGPLDLTARLDQEALVKGVDGERYMVLEITAPEVAGDAARPVDVAVVMDVSSSMAGRGKIAQSRKAVSELIDQLRPTDTFSLVTFSDSAQVDIRPTPVTTPQRLKRRVRGIHTDGGTNIHDGIELGLAQMETSDNQRVQRVLLLSDGLATVGRTAPADIIRATGSRVEEGVSVSTIGLGLDFDENLLMAMSDTGGGTYQFVDRPGQLSEMFAAELRKMTQVVGREVALSVDLGPNVQLLEVYGYDTTKNGDATTIFVGDVHGGEKRKVVARVQIPDDRLTTVDVAEVALSYVNADDGTKGLALASLDALIVDDTALAARSIDKDAGVLAARAAANDMLARGASQFASGRGADAKRLFQESRSLLQSASVQYGTADLDRDLEEVDRQATAFDQHTPSSSGGRRAVKKAKEVARARSR